MQELQKQTSEISTDVQALSHELHSSKLEYLGVVGGMRGWCKEFGERQRVQIDFQTHDLPSLFATRILSLPLPSSTGGPAQFGQAQRGKRIRSATVGESGEIHLLVSDLGRGFDSEAAKQGRGLGLTACRSDSKLVKGMLSINAQPRGGTTIHARVPFDSSSDSARAAG